MQLFDRLDATYAKLVALRPAVEADPPQWGEGPPRDKYALAVRNVDVLVDALRVEAGHLERALAKPE